MLDKKKFEWFSYLSSKWAIKQGKQLTTSKMHLAKKMLTEHVVQWKFKKVCKGDNSLEDKECGGWSLEADNNQFESNHRSWSSYNYTKSCWRIQHQPFYSNLAFEANSFQFSRSVVSNSLRPCGLQHARLLCPSPAPGACSNSCPSSQWCHPTILSPVIPFSSCLQTFPASGSSPMSQFFTSGDQSIRASA